MKDLSLPAGLSIIADKYDAILCDVWGVIHNGRAAFQPACEALVAFRRQGGRVVLITNAPVPKAQVIRYFAPLGVPSEAYDDCISSGDATRALLEPLRGKPVLRLGMDEGWEHDKFLYEGLDLTFTSPEAAEVFICIGLRDHANEHPEEYRGELKAYAELGLPMICANPDVQVRVGDKLYWCAGALADIYRQEGGQVIYPGKPHAAIYKAAYARLANLIGDMPDRSRILAIGDSPATDMRGAVRQGIDGLYVGTGLAEHDGGNFGEEVHGLLQSFETHATYAMPALIW